MRETQLIKRSTAFYKKEAKGPVKIYRIHHPRPQCHIYLFSRFDISRSIILRGRGKSRIDPVARMKYNTGVEDGFLRNDRDFHEFKPPFMFSIIVRQLNMMKS